MMPGGPLNQYQTMMRMQANGVNMNQTDMRHKALQNSRNNAFVQP